MMKTELSFATPAGIETELLAVLAADAQTAKGPDAKPQPVLLTGDEAVKSAAAAVLATGEYKAGANETLLLHAPAGLKAKRLLIVGLGKQAKATIHNVRNAAGTAVRFAKPRGIRELTLALPESEGLSRRSGVCAPPPKAPASPTSTPTPTAATARTRASSPSRSLRHASADQAACTAAFAEGVIIGESQNFARSLVNEPGNKLTPTVLGQRAAAMAKEVGLECEVHSTDKLHELKMGAFWSVSQGSDEPPALIVLRYNPAGVTDGPVLGLVGKGITFDTGGISIKPADNMEKMKYDMAGGAAMLGAMRAIALLKPNVRVIAIVCAAENMPDGKAQKPGDVQTAMSRTSPARPSRSSTPTPRAASCSPTASPTRARSAPRTSSTPPRSPAQLALPSARSTPAPSPTTTPPGTNSTPPSPPPARSSGACPSATNTLT